MKLPQLSVVTWAFAFVCLIPLLGCRHGTDPGDAAARARHETRAKLQTGMTPNDVAAILGQPAEFRNGNGAKDDVGIYRQSGQTYTIYYYQGRLTRVVNSGEPVNR